jgi:hypothetical protein
MKEPEMSNVIRFLESIGGNAPLSPENYAACVATLDAVELQKRALLDCDTESLSVLLSGRKNLRCAVFAADED